MLTKIDLLPHLPQVDLEALEDALARTMPEPRFIPVSATSGEGIAEWVEWLERQRATVVAGPVADEAITADRALRQEA